MGQMELSKVFYVEIDRSLNNHSFITSFYIPYGFAAHNLWLLIFSVLWSVHYVNPIIQGRSTCWLWIVTDHRGQIWCMNK